MRLCVVWLALPAALAHLNACLRALPLLNLRCSQSLLRADTECCLQVSELNKNGCFCHSYVREVLGQALFAVSERTRLLCAAQAAGPAWADWAQRNAVDFSVQVCAEQTTVHGGACAVSDMRVEHERMLVATGLATAVADALASSPACFSGARMLEAIAPFVAPDAALVVPGHGVYQGRAAVAHFFGLLHPALNRGALALALQPRLTQPYLHDCAARVDLLLTFGSRFAQNQAGAWCGSARARLQLSALFLGCGGAARRLRMDVRAWDDSPTDLQAVLASLAALGQTAAEYGALRLCHQHQAHCRGALAQFESLNDCARFQLAVPAQSPACLGRAHAMGNSSSCRLKFAELLQLDPAVYCPAVGPLGAGPLNPHATCSDYSQCEGTTAALLPDAAEAAGEEAQACAEANAGRWSDWGGSALCIGL